MCLVEGNPHQLNQGQIMKVTVSEKPSSELLALAAVAAGRDHLQTSEFARAFNRQSQTCRKNYCLTGECFGIRPLKLGGRLLWPVADVERLLSGGK